MTVKNPHQRRGEAQRRALKLQPWKGLPKVEPVWRAKASCVRTHCGQKQQQAGDRCPGRSAVCFECSKGTLDLGVFPKPRQHQRMSSEDMVFLGSMTTRQKPSWTANIRIGEKEVSFNLNTGGEVTVLSATAYRSLELQKPTTVLYEPA